MNPIRIRAVLLCAFVAVFNVSSQAADKKSAAVGRGKEAPSAEQARETIRAAIKAGVEPAFGAAATAELKKVGVVVVPDQPTPVERRLASIVLEELVATIPAAAKDKVEAATKWDLSGETQAVLAARRDAAAAGSAKPNAARGGASPKGAVTPKSEGPPPELTCDGILAVVCRMRGRDAQVEFALLRAPGPAAGRKPAAGGSRRPTPRGSDKPLWKGTATLARTDLAALPDVPDLNLKVLEFAREHVGQKVGNGECWTLANDALKAAGAKGADGYTFGRELRDGEPALPGDIVQFTSVRLEHANGSWQTLGHPNHTAVVVQAEGDVYQVLHQNMGGVKIVGPAKLNFAAKTEGKIQIFRPVPKSQSASR